ncbi:acyltransferase family protein [Undibacterium sp. TJN19]|uniref:acyltransferase family protein n=1 Tax=Undibacterium sp. TJN19 TaxID=3413055 RepID=UPI003BF21BAF
MQARNATIDIGKGLGIILVVFGHNWIIAHDHGELFRIVFSFHMPLFFFLSGAVLHHDAAFRDYAVFKADALLKPYFIVLLVWGAFRILFAHVPWDTYLAGLLYGTGNTIEWVPLWYLPHLFLAMLAAWGILRIIDCFQSRQVIAWLLAALLLGVGIVATQMVARLDGQAYEHLNHILANHQNNFPGLPWSADLLGISTAFILLGYLLRDKVMHFKPRLWILMLAALVFVALHILFDDTIDLNMRQYDSWWVSTAQAVAGIYLLLCMADALGHWPAGRRVFAYLGNSSLFIMIFHSWIEWKVFTLLGKLDPQASNDYLHAIVALFCGLLLPLLILEVVKRQTLLTKLLLPFRSRL